jgi:glycine/D-amino acid oxidase-like deaminating enzyme
MVDFIIVGQGIAGSILSYSLLKRGKKVLVIDSGNMNSCSAVAAGLFNPITGKRMVKTWNVAKLFPFFHPFYKEMEKDLHSSFFNSVSIYRPFGSIEDQNHWFSHSENSDQGFAYSDVKEDQKLSNIIRNEFGGFLTRHSGWVNVKEMLIGMKKLLQNSEAIKEEVFRFEDLKLEKNQVFYNDIVASKMIFCEGYKALNNPYFKWIPYSPSKGEILTVEIKNFLEDKIINKNLFIVPIGDDLYKIGATFERTTEEGITNKGRLEIEEKINNLIQLPFKVVNQESGIRPSVPDRRPLIGIHPEFSQLAIFNGLGTKGISLSPYYSNQFINYLEGKGELDKEVNIQRYYSLYFRS